jgi:hypothetical protein
VDALAIELRELVRLGQWPWSGRCLPVKTYGGGADAASVRRRGSGLRGGEAL